MLAEEVILDVTLAILGFKPQGKVRVAGKAAAPLPSAARAPASFMRQLKR